MNHTPCPDHRTGPWNRHCHRRDEGGQLAFDSRCPACTYQRIKEMDDREEEARLNAGLR